MCRAAGLAAIVGVLSLSMAHAQPPAAPATPPATTITDLSPVTDAMLANPDPADWPMWRRTLDNWGYSPLDQIDRRNVEQLRLVWSRPLAEGDQEGTPLVHDGICISRIRSTSRRRSMPRPAIHLGVPPQGAGRRGRVLPCPGNESQSRDLRQPDSRQRRGRLRLRAECAHRRARLGDVHPRLPQGREEQLGADHCERQSHLRAQLRTGRRSRSLRDHRIRCVDGQGTVAQTHDSEARRARRRNLGQHPVRAALARRHVDGAELRSAS